jgi:hypothetical protein
MRKMAFLKPCIYIRKVRRVWGKFDSWWGMTHLSENTSSRREENWERDRRRTVEEKEGRERERERERERGGGGVGVWGSVEGIK